MPAKKAAKKSRKGSKKSAAKKVGTKRAAKKGVKKAVKKGAGAKSAPKKGAAKKTAAARKSAPQKSATRGVSSETSAAATTLAMAACIDIPTAEDIVFACVPASVGVNQKLKTFLGPANMELFQQCVLNGVLGRNCDINRSEIPAGGDNTLRDVIDAIVINARPA